MKKKKSANSSGILSIDIHGLSAKAAKEQTLQAVSDAIMRGYDELEIIHGRGSGTLKFVVHEVLATLNVVTVFWLSNYNDGITRVRF